ncbi:PaaX family transcriptional regulator C-terminal domain-containing protein [Actinomadura sediminis]|uniref:PaaX family transcriptional regulator C-terminal domain-containing protein n=1 Tax=Actinomadura sediminis TaxID=1038904 RepID=A0ABW3EUW2_9ACTN
MQAGQARRVDPAGSAGEERDLIAQAWDLAAIRPLFTDFVERFAGLDPATDEDAFVARLRMVHAWRLVFDRDPRLPVEFLPPDWPGTAATDLFIDNWLTWYEAADRWWRGLCAG